MLRGRHPGIRNGGGGVIFQRAAGVAAQSHGCSVPGVVDDVGCGGGDSAGVFEGDGMDHAAEPEDWADQQVDHVWVWAERGALEHNERVGSGVCARVDADADDVLFVSGAGEVDGSCAGGSGAGEWGDGMADDEVGEFAVVVASDIGWSDLCVHDGDIDI